ncbi:uncharacterized protein [Nicotiana sylvestris]|uniref:uncharacterized protein n=1 Tax=Nicotiana sylvestris TaxID=4096 RepID=UPI00388CBE64
MRILELHGVDFTIFQLEGRARRWWQSYVLCRPEDSPPITWGQFTQLFLDRYIPPSKREELRYQVEHLEQGQISVTDYEARFFELSCHALMILLTDAERLRRFIAGLHPTIRAGMAREVEMGIGYQLVVEIARRIEGYCHRGREQMQQDKRARFFGEFRGAPARGRGQFGRGQPSRPPYSAPLPDRGAPARPYFSTMPESSYRPSAMPESSYRPPAIQASSSGSTGFQSQPSGQQVIAPRGCFKCEDPGHMRRYYPRLRGKAVQQGQQPMILAPAAQPPRGGGQVGRGRPRGGGQAGRGQSAIAQLGGGQPDGAPARFYALPARPDALSLDAVITGIISVGGRDASLSSLFARFLVISPEPLGTPIHVSTPVGNSVVVDRIYRSCVVTFCGFQNRADFLLLDMIGFEVILGMDWLDPYHAVLDCHAKTVSLVMLGLSKLEWKGSTVGTPSRVISFLKARHMVEKGCLAYLAYVQDTTADYLTIDLVPVVREFANVFPSDLPGMPPDRDIDFCIDLAPGTQPISIPSYRMAPKELKEQL